MGNEILLGVQKVKKMGSFHYLTVPKAIFDSGMINDDESYQVRLIPMKQDKTGVSS